MRLLSSPTGTKREVWGRRKDRDEFRDIADRKEMEKQREAIGRELLFGRFWGFPEIWIRAYQRQAVWLAVILQKLWSKVGPTPIAVRTLTERTTALRRQV